MALGDLIRVATPEDTDAIVNLLAAVHADSLVGRWLAAGRKGAPLIEWDAIVSAALGDPRNLVHIVPDVVCGIAGVAVWYDHHTQYPPTVGFGIGPIDSCSPHTDRLGLLQAGIGSYHPDTLPHHHLGYLAVDAAFQEHRHDVASALLDHHHTFLDLADLPAFTFTADEDTLNLLTAHDYHPNRPIELRGAPPLHPVWRLRRSARTADGDE